jgi:hypothetical protein
MQTTKAGFYSVGELLFFAGQDGHIAAHTTPFISPVKTEQSGIPNPCTSCHAEKSNAWAINALRQWESVSPWRVN